MNRMSKQKTTRIRLNKGWSHDEKFIVKEGQDTVLLRVLDASKLSRKIKEMDYLSDLDLGECAFSTPLSVELVNDKVHYVTSYLQGVDLEEVITDLSESEQIRLGLQAGCLLKQIHSQIRVKEDHSWAKEYSAKIDRKIQSYRACGLRFDHDDALIEKVSSLKTFLEDRPVTFQHGDYHSGNFLLCENGNLGILDFDRWDIGDPWEEFNRIVWCREKSPLFASAMIQGYFDFDVPKTFFPLMFLYVATNAIGSIVWAQGYSDDEVSVMLHLIKRLDEDTDHFTLIVPCWFQTIQL